MEPRGALGLKRHGGQGGPIAQIQLLEDIAQVNLHGAGRDLNPLRDFLVAHSGGHEGGNFALTGRQQRSYRFIIIPIGDCPFGASTGAQWADQRYPAATRRKRSSISHAVKVFEIMSHAPLRRASATSV